MVDTQRIQSAPQCISGIAELAASMARRHEDHCTSTLEVTSYLPLDVETVSRMLEGLEERHGIGFVERDSVCYLHIAHPDDYNLRILDLESGEHIQSNASLQRHLAELREDPTWKRKMQEQHKILHIAASASGAILDLSYFTRRTKMPNARVQSILNDLVAGGHIQLHVGDDSGSIRYTFPSFEYPSKRFARNMEVFEELPEAHRWTGWLMTASIVLIAILAFALLRF